MNLLKALVLYVDKGYPPENRNMGQVYQLITLNSETALNSLHGRYSLCHAGIRWTFRITPIWDRRSPGIPRGIPPAGCGFKGTYGTSGWMSRKEMAGVLELVADLHRYQGIVLGMLDRKAVCLKQAVRGFCRVADGQDFKQAVQRSFGVEGYEKSSEYLRDKGYTVRVFNLVNPENSDSWNCLSEVEGQGRCCPGRWSQGNRRRVSALRVPGRSHPLL